jgi:isoprenylcysteine carboxyl methyltransferase (ICMT) family protein YpbQ
MSEFRNPEPPLMSEFRNPEPPLLSKIRTKILLFSFLVRILVMEFLSKLWTRKETSVYFLDSFLGV